MEAEYKKDLRHNYMVIAESDSSRSYQYCIKMLENQTIDGILPLEHRRIDNKLLFYYEITALQSMNNLLEKITLSYDKVRQLCMYILNTLERAYEYLLPEDDFILAPEYIYMDINTYAPSLCFFSGYDKNIKEQMKCLLEYLMNKIDYNNKDAVLLVYQLYATSREEGFTFGQLREVLEGKEQPDRKEVLSPKEKSIINVMQEECNPNANSDKATKQKSIIETNKNCNTIPTVMMEKVEGETELAYYPMKAFLFSGASILGGILVIIFSLITKILYNSFGNRIDYSRLFALILILFCVEGYLLKIIWNRKNKVTKMVNTQSYIDPRQDYIHQGVLHDRNADTKADRKADRNADRNADKKICDRAENDKKQNDDRTSIEAGSFNDLQLPKIHSGKVEENNRKKIEKNQKELGIGGLTKVVLTKEEEDYNPTCLLNATEDSPDSLILKALDEINYKNIPITSYPFFIGKLKKNVDYCLEKDVISRFHAKITREGEEYFITDLNSTNGTFINSNPLLTYQKKEIRVGDEIAFANIKYQFMQQ